MKKREHACASVGMPTPRSSPQLGASCPPICHPGGPGVGMLQGTNVTHLLWCWCQQGLRQAWQCPVGGQPVAHPILRHPQEWQRRGNGVELVGALAMCSNKFFHQGRQTNIGVGLSGQIALIALVAKLCSCCSS